MVSTDDRLHPVVGYSFNGSFSYDKMPAPLRVLLDDYDRQLQALQASGIEEISNPYASKVEKTPETAAVAPLLGDICWSQDEPFNELCPKDKNYKDMRTPVGCVATAAAQIMKYHAYPTHGIGSRTYITSQGKTVNADFETATYDWTNMLPDYNGAFTQQQADAVALLCYHVAVAGRMDFDYEGSGTSAKEIAKAFTRNFGYDRNIEYLDRTHYDEPTWNALMLAELQAGRPILQFGEGEGGGHAFVCDGYDGKGFFPLQLGMGRHERWLLPFLGAGTRVPGHRQWHGCLQLYAVDAHQHSAAHGDIHAPGPSASGQSARSGGQIHQPQR